MILCVGTTPAVQRVMVFPNLVLDEVNRAVTTLDGPAGKAVNVAKVLQALGEHPIATGFLGGRQGQQLRTWMEARGLELDFVSVNAATRQCVTVIDAGAGTVTELVEESRPVAATDYEVLLARIRQRMPDCRAVVLSGTLTPQGPEAFYRQCVDSARQAGVLAILDAKGPPLIEALQAKPTLVKPNRAELEATLARPLETEDAMREALAQLRERGAQQVVLTAGKNPTLAFDGRHFWRIRCPVLHAVNPIGSGDAFTAGLVWQLLRGTDLGEACRWATAAGAANALSSMAGEVNLADVERLARQVTAQRIP